MPNNLTTDNNVFFKEGVMAAVSLIASLIAKEGATKLAVLREAFSSIKLIVIDEISMVGADTLLTIHRRLCDIMNTTKPFGGMSILAVGDLLQLPPVAQRPVFAEPSDEMSSIYGSLWQTHFKIVQLTEIQRQKDDPKVFVEVSKPIGSAVFCISGRFLEICGTAVELFWTIKWGDT